MNPTIHQHSLNLFQGLRNRFRTRPPSASMTLAQGLENAGELIPRVRRDRRLAEDDAMYQDRDYDPNSAEPRYLQMAKAELMRRKDLKCRDCGFIGLPAPDQNCPECGGIMDEPSERPQPNQVTADQIRTSIRQQVVDQQKARKTESAHRTIPGHTHDIHLTDLITHYGYRADGDHYTVRGDRDNTLHVNTNGRWIHEHHGVRHEGHGHKALAAHLARTSPKR